MANLPVLRFNSGELTEQADARSDVEKYSGGCRTLENLIARIYGGAARRPGTKYIDDATQTPLGVDNTVVRVIPFVYSDSVAYVVELGNKYAKFYYDGAALDDSGDVTITTPYLAADIMDLYITQIADVMWIVHKSYPPSKLSRTGTKTFELNEIDFRNGPFLTRNDLIDPANPSATTLTASTTAAGSSGTITASVNIFQREHAGALFMLIHPRTTTYIEQEGSGTSDSIEVLGDFSFNTHGTWDGTVKLQRNENEAGWEDYRTYRSNDDRNIQLSSSEESANTYYRINVSGDDVTECRVDLTLNDVYRKGIVKTNAYVSPSIMSMEVYSTIESTDATKRWHEGAWSYSRGFPSCVTFFQERCVYSGASVSLDDDEFDATEYPSLRI